MPRKSDRPVMMRFLMEFMFVNWRKESPTDAARFQRKMASLQAENNVISIWSQSKSMLLTHKAEEQAVQRSKNRERNWCKNGPKFSCKSGALRVIRQSRRAQGGAEIMKRSVEKPGPKMEKKIMKPAEIWTTLRLPTRVIPRSPTFSLAFGKTHLRIIPLIAKESHDGVLTQRL